ncbi:fused MFS/spermidine synthase [Paenibacillus sp. J2TS4]|uniref:fused MFS/spermidine synthase n=1 Tax=Paenibacillus sp. J2TS4 TaxID=2807194 RepID=UPI001B038CD1|nr:fused MFS/spermidine synthase [Paenibacillus sp. J2TS4]GIP31524.1 spermidine synthase [Paenibacillus sp. J2TS4]
MNGIIYIVLFLVSFVYMGLEMAAGRIVTPYFGSSVYTWGAVISVFLIGSSLGYWIGGRGADSPRNRLWLSFYMSAAAVSIAFLPMAAALILPPLQTLPEPYGILAGTVGLFIVPNLFLSAVIPGMTKIGLTTQFTGQKIGSYYTISAIGSIVGTMVTTFVLLPAISVAGIIMVNLALLILALFLFRTRDSWVKAASSLGLGLLCLIPLIPQTQVSFAQAKLVAHVSSPYQELYITERESYRERPGHYRFLQFSQGGYQGGIDLNQPDALLFPYTRMLLDLLMGHHPDSRTVYMIGHGIGTLTSRIDAMGKQIEAAEIDGKVLEVSRQYFGYEGGHVEVGDGRMLLGRKPDRSQDVILVDAYNGGSIPFHLTTSQFFQMTSRKLRDDGLLLMNVIGQASDDEFVESVYATVRSIYPYAVVYAADPGSPDRQNLYIAASPQPLDPITLEGVQEIHVGLGTVITDEKTPFVTGN